MNIFWLRTASCGKSAIEDEKRTMSGPHGGTAKQFVE